MTHNRQLFTRLIFTLPLALLFLFSVTACEMMTPRRSCASFWRSKKNYSRPFIRLAGNGKIPRVQPGSERAAYEAAVEDLIGELSARLRTERAVLMADPVLLASIKTDIQCYDESYVYSSVTMDASSFVPTVTEYNRHHDSSKLSNEAMQACAAAQPLRAARHYGQTAALAEKAERYSTLIELSGWNPIVHHMLMSGVPQYPPAPAELTSPVPAAELWRRAAALLCRTPLMVAYDGQRWGASLVNSAFAHLAKMGLPLTTQSSGAAILELRLLDGQTSEVGPGVFVASIEIDATLREPDRRTLASSVRTVTQGTGANPDAAHAEAVQQLISKELGQVLNRLMASVAGPSINCDSFEIRSLAGSLSCLASPDNARVTQSEDLRLIETSGGLSVVGRIDDLRRGSLLYVLEQEPVVPTSQTRTRLGVVEVIAPQGQDLFKVAWFCRGSISNLPIQGLPVEVIRDASTSRVGRCWGSYSPREPESCHNANFIDLDVQLGSNDGVKEEDIFEVLGSLSEDSSHQRVPEFVRFGSCVIMPGALQARTSVCRLVRRENTTRNFDRRTCFRGGFVHQQ